jgi:hypothetical protein
VLLSGGGDPEALGPVVERLVTEVRRGTAAAPTIGVLPGGSRELIDAVTRLGSAAGVTVTELPTAPATSDVLPLNALVVGDGDAAQLLMALGEVVTDVRGLVHRGASYLGIGAGAAIAADTVLLGGSEIGGVPTPRPKSRPPPDSGSSTSRWFPRPRQAGGSGSVSPRSRRNLPTASSASTLTRPS